MKETNKRQDETDSRVEDNRRNIEDLRNLVEATRRELREQTAMSEGLAGRMQRIMEEELREREARRLNLVLHGVPEPGPNIKEMRERMEMDREECEHIFVRMGARTRKHQIRFCRRVGEWGQNPRPLVIGLYSEENRRHILEYSRYLQNTRYEAVSVVPDLTQSQRRGEQRLREEAEGRNQELTKEDRERNLRWITVGSRGEKRLIKGTEREDQTRGEPGWRGGWMGGGRGEGSGPVRGLQANNRTRREELNGEADHTNSIDGGNGSAQGLRRNGQDGAGAGMQSGEGSSENGGGGRREELNKAASHSSGTTSTEGRGGIAQGPRNNAEGRGGITQGPRRSGQNEDRAGVRDEGVSLESGRREGNHDNEEETEMEDWGGRNSDSATEQAMDMAMATETATTMAMVMTMATGGIATTTTTTMDTTMTHETTMGGREEEEEITRLDTEVVHRGKEAEETTTTAREMPTHQQQGITDWTGAP